MAAGKEEKDMKKDLPAKGSEWVRLILSGLVFLAFIPATILALPKVMELSDPQARLQFQQELQSLGDRRLADLFGDSGAAGGGGDDSR